MNRRAPILLLLAATAVVILAACSGSAKPGPNEPPSNGSATEEEPVQVTQNCSTDEDCRLFSDYCTGCDCRVLGKGEADPTCDGPGVRCVADPCMNKTAACQAGVCALVEPAPQ